LLPKISIITPLLNGADYIKNCIDSCSSQNYSEWEQIFIDGGSTDKSIEIIKTHPEYNNGRIKLLNAPETNACEAWNIGISKASGHFIGWLGADDLAKKGSFKFLSDVISRNPGANFIYGEADIIDAKGKITGRYATKDFDLNKLIGSPCNFVAAVSVFLSKELINKVGRLRTDVNACDFDFFLRCGIESKPLRTGFIFSEYRIHKGGVSGSIGSKIYPKEFFKISLDYGASYFSPAAKNYYYFLATQNIIIKAFYKLKSAYLKKKFLKYAFKSNKIAIFGASITGNHCFEYLISIGKNVTCFIDNYPPLNKRFHNIPVYNPKEFLKHAKKSVLVVLASGKTNSEMKKQLKDLNFKGSIVFWYNKEG
jgi:glycosyltransferase involved in cell wall biosynthesis